MSRRPAWLPRLDARDRALVRRVVVIGVLTFLLGFGATAGIFYLTGSRADVVTVPDVRRLTLARADRVLRRADLQIMVSDSLPNARVARGAVLTQSPLPGQEVAPETAVRLILSRGPEEVTMPTITMYDADQAQRILSASGLQVRLQTVPDLAAQGRVIGTVPTAGSAVAIPGPVRLLISAGPPIVSVPTVIGLAQADARALLRSTSLRVGEEQRVYRPDLPEGTVLSQFPMPGDSTRAGTRVRLQIVSGQAIVEKPDTTRETEAPVEPVPAGEGGAP